MRSHNLTLHTPPPLIPSTALADSRPLVIRLICSLVGNSSSTGPSLVTSLTGLAVLSVVLSTSSSQLMAKGVSYPGTYIPKGNVVTC